MQKMYNKNYDQVCIFCICLSLLQLNPIVLQNIKECSKIEMEYNFGVNVIKTMVSLNIGKQKVKKCLNLQQRYMKDPG